MDLPDPEVIIHGYAIFLRAGAFLMLLPFVGQPVPLMVRTATSIYLAFLMLPLVEPHPAVLLPGGLAELLLLSVREILIGAVMGFAVLLLFHLCHYAGQFISMQMGLMQSNLFNPITQEQSTVMSTAFTMLTIVIIFTLEVHHSLLFAFNRSLEIMPGGSPLTGDKMLGILVLDVGKIFIVGVQMAAPLIAVNYIVTLSFAVLGRAVPNMNVLMLSFGVRIGMGFIVMIMVLVVLVQMLIGMIYDSPIRMLQFLPFR
jgi:flagellar biosynthetic protein FliR